MNNLPIINVYNKKSKVCLFLRDNQGGLKIRWIKDFHPYYYEKNEEGKYIGYDGTKLQKIIVNEPKEIPIQRSNESYESDVRFTHRYIIDKIDKFDKCPIKHIMLDIEILTPKGKFPEPTEALYPISSITIYNSRYEVYRSWFLGDYEGTIEQKEIRLMQDFIDYLKKAKFDLWLSWNVDFDYGYLTNRFAKLPQKYFFDKVSKYNNFAKIISPIGMVRGSGSQENDYFYPAGTSIVDLLGWTRKIIKGLKSYSLDNVALEVLGKGKVLKNKDVDFSTINKGIKERNLQDVRLMKEINDKLKLIDYYDEIRRFSKSDWENVYWNSRVIDSLILQEAKEKKVILPKKSYHTEETTFKGAYRWNKDGFFENIYSADLTSAYPSMLIDFSLSPENIIENDSIKKSVIEVNGVSFQQRINAILPSLARKLLIIKNKLKKEKKSNSNLQSKYDAMKALVNSLFGVTAYRNFRLFEPKVASSITYLVRDLLHYIEENFKGGEIIYIDTDSIKYLAKEDKINLLNKLVKQWGRKKYGIDTNVEFEREEKYNKLLILGMCHYYGIKGKKIEIRGIEVKRSSSSVFEAKFQEELINKVLDKQSQDKITEWIKVEIKRIKESPIIDFSFPCKLAKPIDEYQTYLIRKSKDKETGKVVKKKFDKKLPIFLRGLLNAQKANPKFKKNVKELYWWLYYNEEDKVIPMAFDEDTVDKIDKDKICWQKIIERCILNKVKVIFEAMKWESELFPIKVRKKKVKAPKSAQNPLQDSPIRANKDKVIRNPLEIETRAEMTKTEPYYSE